jgi:hypothetical protein
MKFPVEMMFINVFLNNPKVLLPIERAERVSPEKSPIIELKLQH